LTLNRSHFARNLAIRTKIPSSKMALYLSSRALKQGSFCAINQGALPNGSQQGWDNSSGRTLRPRMDHECKVGCVGACCFKLEQDERAWPRIHDGGYAFYVHDNRLVYAYNAYNEDRFYIRSDAPLPTGEVELKAEYQATGRTTGLVMLFINGEQVGQGEVGRTMPAQFSLSETFDVGEDTGTPVSKDYTRENAFSGTLNRVVINLAQ
jgi:hypothetical protein